MKKLLAVLLLLLLLPFAALAEKIEMEVYLIDPCGGCGGTVGRGCKSCTIQDEIANRYRLMFPEDEVRIQFNNLRMDKTLEPEMRERISEFGADPDEVPLPLMFVRGQLFLADGSMDEALARFLETGEYPGIEAMLREKAEYEASRVPGRVVYLYSSYCEDCREISKWLTYSLPADYELVKYDIYTEAGQTMEKYLLETLEIPEEEYCIPLIVYGDFWFAGKNSIYMSMKSRIQEYPDEQSTILEEIQ